MISSVAATIFFVTPQTNMGQMSKNDCQFEYINKF